MCPIKDLTIDLLNLIVIKFNKSDLLVSKAVFINTAFHKEGNKCKFVCWQLDLKCLEIPSVSIPGEGSDCVGMLFVGVVH